MIQSVYTNTHAQLRLCWKAQSVALSTVLPKCHNQISKENKSYPIIQQCVFFFRTTDSLEPVFGQLRAAAENSSHAKFKHMGCGCCPHQL